MDLLSPKTTVRELEPKLQELPVYPGDALFPDGEKQFGLKLEYIKGANGLPVELAPSSFDSRAPLRDRVGFEAFEQEMPLFRDSHKMTEAELRQYMLAQNASENNDGMQAALASALREVYDDRLDLIKGARATNERMKMQILSSGKIGIEANDEKIDIDYGFGDNQFITVEDTDAWSDPQADILTTIERVFDQATENGAEIEVAMMTSKTLAKLTANEQLRDILKSANVIRVNRRSVQDFLEEEFGITIILNDYKYRDRNDYTVKNFFPDDVVSFFPQGALGEMVYSYTTEELALANGSTEYEVETVNTGLTLISKTEGHVPNKDVIAAQICLPTFERANEVFILNVEPIEEVTP